MEVGDLVSPNGGRRTHWVGLVLEKREENEFDTCEGSTECLIQWVCTAQGSAWWADWSLEVISGSR